MDSTRKVAVIVGVLFIIATVTAIIGLFLYGPILNDPNYIIRGSANETQVRLGAFFELVLAFAVIGTSITLFPIIRKQNESIALGYVCFRLLEAAIIVVGIISLLSVVTLSQEFTETADPNVPSFLTAGSLLVAVHNWTFLFGPQLTLGASTLMLAYLLYKSRLVPRFIPVLGLIGGPLIFVSAVAILFGLYDQLSIVGSIASIPVAVWEMALAGWLIVKGFNSHVIASFQHASK
jgi:Domain of unknown function (DUF4386)